MAVYFVSNNLLANNVKFDFGVDIEDKKLLRPLSSEGVKLAVKLQFNDVTNIYSSNYISCIEGAKYLSEKKNIDVHITDKLVDCKVGDLKNQSIKMLSFFQEHDFDFKQPGGESLNECAKRIGKFVEKLRINDENAVVFLPRRALFSYMIPFTDHGFNLDDRLVLLKDDVVFMENTEEDIEIFKFDYDNGDPVIYQIK